MLVLGSVIDGWGVKVFFGKIWLLAIDFVISFFFSTRFSAEQICCGQFWCLTMPSLSRMEHGESSSSGRSRRPGRVWFFSFHWVQLMVNWWFGFLESPYERDCYLGLRVPLESQTINPNHQFLLWVDGCCIFAGDRDGDICLELWVSYTSTSAEVLRYPATVTPRIIKTTS